MNAGRCPRTVFTYLCRSEAEGRACTAFTVNGGLCVNARRVRSVYFAGVNAVCGACTQRSQYGWGNERPACTCTAFTTRTMNALRAQRFTRGADSARCRTCPACRTQVQRRLARVLEYLLHTRGDVLRSAPLPRALWLRTAQRSGGGRGETSIPSTGHMINARALRAEHR
eukprot:1788687-Prymnesium_polylepis.2